MNPPADSDTQPDSPADAPPAAIEQRAVEARQAGDFLLAAALFAQAADEATEQRTALNLQIRQACCLVAAERYADADALARAVAGQARTEGFDAELVDALGLVVDEHQRAGHWAEAADVLTEAAWKLDHLPNERELHQVIHNMAVTYAKCGFVEAALELYDRALRLATDDHDRQFAYSNMSSAYHEAALREPDPQERHRLLHDGLYAATAALDPEGAHEVMAIITALAHRSMMLAQIGHYHAAIDDARTARRMASEHGMREELVVAMAGEAMSLWGMSHDPGVRRLVQDTFTLAREVGMTQFLDPLHELEVDLLWHEGRHEEARAALEQEVHGLRRRLHDERMARWAHVRLGVEQLVREAERASDALTGVGNRRHLVATLPETLREHSPVCVGVIDLDGFRRVNQEFGYARGDEMLQELARLLERVCRRGDQLVRLGGDQFAMVLRETSPGDARVVFERVRQLVGMRNWHGIPPEVRLTASVGITVGNASSTPDDLLTTAAKALEHAKACGRDRISIR